MEESPDNKARAKDKEELMGGMSNHEYDELLMDEELQFIIENFEFTQEAAPEVRIYSFIEQIESC